MKNKMTTLATQEEAAKGTHSSRAEVSRVGITDWIFGCINATRVCCYISRQPIANGRGKTGELISFSRLTSMATAERVIFRDGRTTSICSQP